RRRHRRARGAGGRTRDLCAALRRVARRPRHVCGARGCPRGRGRAVVLTPGPEGERGRPPERASVRLSAHAPFHPTDAGTAMSPLLAHDPVTATGAEPERWMLVLHGIYGQGRNWASVARRFVRERPSWGLMLVDLRLHGASTGFEPPHTVPRCAEDVAALAETLGAPVEGVLGHSFGGKVALLYAALAPRPPAQLWLVDSQPGPRDPDGSAWHMLEVLRRFPGPFSDRAEGIAAVE